MLAGLGAGLSSMLVGLRPGQHNHELPGPLILVAGHGRLEVLPSTPTVGRPLMRLEVIEPHEVTLGPPWFSGTEASLDLFLGLGVTTAP